MKIIELTKGMVAIVDDEDFAELAQYRWHCDKDGYAIRTRRDNGKRKTVSMHSEILKVPDGLEVDHKNTQKCDNRRENLRIATRSQNMMNTGVRSDNTSGFKGVSWHKRSQKWQATICLNGKRKHLGQFDTAIAASAAYEAEAVILFGEFRRMIGSVHN